MTSSRSIVAAAVPFLLACGTSSPSSSSSAVAAGAGGGAAAGPTWAEDVAPILMKSCASCHAPGGIAPFSLLTYDDVKDKAGLIKTMTAARTMPPFNLDNTGACNTFADARWLEDAEIATLGAWADAGAPEGDASKAPAPPGPPEGLKGKTLTLDMGVTYTPDPQKSDEYRCFIVDPALDADAFLTGYEAIPGDQRVVHHLILFSLDSDKAEQDAAQLDANDEGDGYECFGGPGVTSSRFIAGWAPGAGATYFPKDTGIRLSAGRKVVMQIHYNLSNGSFPDRTKLDLALVPGVATEATVARVGANGFTLPAGQSSTLVTGHAPISASQGKVTVWGVGPHMHTRGKTQDAWYDGPGGEKTCLSKVGHWDFHWQGFSLFEQPIQLTGGGTLGVTCGYDTSHDTKDVPNGEGTDDEMCIDFLYVTKAQ